jgi:hypothetical protein
MFPGGSIEARRAIRQAFDLLYARAADRLDDLWFGSRREPGDILVDEFEGEGTTFSFGVAPDELFHAVAAVVMWATRKCCPHHHSRAHRARA